MTVQQREAEGPLPGRRRTLLTEFVNERGQATVAELADAFGVSTDTVRRDLDWLARRGAVSRTYGGAVSLSGRRPCGTCTSSAAPAA
jgi:DeoR/GlpR family transcriptional regulator of sugar metabolism